jgi:hypothetical protein
MIANHPPALNHAETMVNATAQAKSPRSRGAVFARASLFVSVPPRIGRSPDERSDIRERSCGLHRCPPGIAEPVIGPATLGRTRWLTRATKTRNKGEGCGTPADAYGMSHATRTNVAIRPRFGRGAALKRRPLTCRRSATALTAANQRRRSAPDALPGTRLRSRCCLPPPVPVQRQSRRPVMMPAGRISEAAREQDVSSHPREPHPPPRRKHPRGEVLRERMIRR